MPEADPWGNAGRPASAPTRRGVPALSRSHSGSGCCGDNEEGSHQAREDLLCWSEELTAVAWVTLTPLYRTGTGWPGWAFSSRGPLDRGS